MAIAAVLPRDATGRAISLGGTRIPVVLPRLADARLHVAAVVVTLHVLGQVGLGFHVSVPQIVASILTCAVIQVAVTFRRTGALVWPASAMLTGSGVALILRVPTTPVGDHWTFHRWWVFAGVAALSLATKWVVRRDGTHVFNPSNLGLVAAFLALGSMRAEPLDFWWAPLDDPSMLAAYGVIGVGGTLITARLGLLRVAAAFWATFAALWAVVAASGHCFTARWAFAPVCGVDQWRAVVVSPELLIFLFFMITDPRTVPAERTARVRFGALVAVVAVLLMAPQSTEFGTKVALLAGLTVMSAARPLVERGAARPLRLPALAAASLLVLLGAWVGGRSAKGLVADDPELARGRVVQRIDPATFPAITIDRGVLDWNHEISGPGARAIVLTLAENLELESRALLARDGELLEAIAHGDRLDDLRARMRAAEATGATIVQRHDLDRIRVALLVPFGRQDGLSLGMVSSGTRTTETYAPDGTLVRSESAPFATTFAMRRATGARWMIVAELPADVAG